jgi:hypothetical protein
MILNNAPQNEAVLSNVGEIGEFRIRNSAKAFNILSSGLYANKIRAIIRELSCNAVDSHVAAGKPDVQFEIHIPNSLDPHFSIRDYGTGLSHEQVTQIYTTYFESTKTNSNEFIGALGLGSKSPFSYTDNFTITAIQGNKKGIYSAFINGEGVPSIALMMEEATDEESGVEIKFSVNDRYDFYKFRDEAQKVFRHFKLLPKVNGCSEFRFELPDYETQNIIPGVHTLTNGRRSVAVMGNIAYPIEVPNAEASLGNLNHFGGERIMIVKINPRDVVSIPSDYNDTKGRACRYEVIGELNKEEAPEDAFTSPVQANGNTIVKQEAKEGSSDFFAGYEAGYMNIYNADISQNYREGYSKGRRDFINGVDARYVYVPVKNRPAWTPVV